MISEIKSAEKIIDNIKDNLGRTVYEAWKKLLVSGIPPLTLLKSKGEELVEYTVYGESIQCDENLIDYKTFSSRNQTSFPLTINNNGSLHYVGDYYIQTNASFMESGKTYTFNCDYKCEDDVNPFWRILYTDGSYSATINLGNSFTIPTGKTVDKLFLYVEMSATVHDITYYNIQLIDKLPSPDTPIEVESVGDKTKNLFNPSKLSFNNTATSSGRVEGNNIIIETTSDYTGNGLIITKQKLKDLADLEVGKTYILRFIRNGEKVNQAYNRYIYILSTNKLWNSGEALTITQEMLDSVLYFYGLRQGSGEGTGTLTITNFQIEEGSTVTEYEPYGYRIPVRVRGKNLFDGQFEVGFISENAGENVDTTNTLYWRTKNYIEVVDNMKCSYQKYEKDSGFFVVCYDKNKNFIGRVGKIYVDVANLTNNVLLDGTKYIRIFWELQAKTDDIKTVFDYLQIEQGETTEYEPYVEPITTNIYLDEPLRKIGDYKDYIDFDTKTFYKKIFEYVFTGNEYWASPINPLTNTIRSYASNIFSGRKALSFAGLSEKGIFDGISTNSGDQERCQYVTNSSNVVSFYARILKSRCADPENPVADDFKNIYTKGTKVHGVFDTPIEETIELPSIPTHKGTTIIEVNTNIQPSDMEVTYLGKA